VHIAAVQRDLQQNNKGEQYCTNTIIRGKNEQMSALGEMFGLLGGVPMMFINGDLHVDKSRGGRVLIVVWGTYQQG
jgi:hypothetical protein